MGLATRHVQLDWRSIELRGYTGDIAADGNAIALRDDEGKLWPLRGGNYDLKLRPGDRVTLFWCVHGGAESRYVAGANHTRGEIEFWPNDLETLIVPPNYPLLFWIAAMSALLSLASFTTGVSTSAVAILTLSLGFFAFVQLRLKKVKDAIHALRADIERQQSTSAPAGGADGHVRI